MYWRGARFGGEPGPFYILAVICVYVWVLGLIDVYSIGWLFHLILLLALAFVMLGLWSGDEPLAERRSGREGRRSRRRTPS